MARVKDWLIDMEECTYAAIERGFTSFDDCVAYVRTQIPYVDEEHIRNVLEAFYAPEWDYA